MLLKQFVIEINRAYKSDGHSLELWVVISQFQTSWNIFNWEATGIHWV